MKFISRWLPYTLLGIGGLVISMQLIFSAFVKPQLDYIILFVSSGGLLALFAFTNLCLAWAFSIGSLAAVHGKLDCADLIKDANLVLSKVPLRLIRYIGGKFGGRGEQERFVFFWAGGRPWTCLEKNFLVR